MKRLVMLMAALGLTTMLALPALSAPSAADTGSPTAGGANASGKPHHHAPRWRPAQGAYFNTPRHGALQWVLHQHIVAAIQHARPGSYIRIALFSFDRKYVAGQLIRAHRRGVHVQVLLNDHQVTPAQRMLHRALGTNRWRKSFAYECHHGCRSTGENLHTKFYLFSHTGGARNVVMTGSVNLTGNSAMNQYNDLWVNDDASHLTRAFRVLFRQMRRDKPAHPAYLVQNIGHHYQLQATPFPNPGPHHDPIIKILNRVKCLGATRGTGNRVHHTVIRVIMHAWNDPRGVYIAQKMRWLYGHGCDVKLILGYGGAAVRAKFAERTHRGFIPVHTTGKDTNGDGLIDLYTHQKELLISGHYGGSRHSRLVVTGSSNYNTDGVRGDEEIFLIHNRRPAWFDYIHDFKRMWTRFSTRVHYIPYSAMPVNDGRAMGHDSAQRMGQPVAPRLIIAAPAKRGGPAWESD